MISLLLTMSYSAGGSDSQDRLRGDIRPYMFSPYETETAKLNCLVQRARQTSLKINRPGVEQKKN